MRRIVACFLLTVACSAKSPPPAPPVAPPAPPPAIAGLAMELEKVRVELGVPAVAAAAWRDGALLEQAAVGVRIMSDPSSHVTTSDLWHLGSNTKAMTATLIGIHVDRGTLHWTDTIGAVFGGTVDPGYKDVTLDQLLHHEGGAPGDPPPLIWRQLWDDGPAPDARSKFVRAIIAMPPAQKPGTFVYSNAGYMIAGAMLEAKTGKRWEELIKTELFDKLGMSSCGFGPPGVAGKADQPRAHKNGEAVEPGVAADNPPGLGPAGTVHCSLSDYGKFLSLHATGMPALVSADTLAHLHTAEGESHYAAGWLALEGERGTVLAHSGSNTMWYVTAVVFPAQKLAFVIATNAGEQKLENAVPELLKRYVE